MIARYRAALMVSAFVFFLPLTAHSEIKPGSTEVSVFGGYNWFEDNQNLNNQPVYGARLGYNFTKYFGIEGVVEYIDSGVDDKTRTDLSEGQFGSPMNSVDLTFYHLDAIYHFMPDSKFTPFVAVGFGGAHYNPDISTKEMAAFNVGVGAKYQLADNIALRVDLRDYMVTEIVQETYHNVAATVGISYSFGGPRKPAPVEKVEYEAKPEPKVEEKVVVAPLPAPPMKSEKCFTVELKVEFDFDKSLIKSEHIKSLNEFADLMASYPDHTVNLEGNTDDVGTDQYNMKLGQRRAESVRNFLLKNFKNIDSSRLTALSHGESKPIGTNETQDGRQRNRRVYATFTYCKK